MINHVKGFRVIKKHDSHRGTITVCGLESVMHHTYKGQHGGGAGYGAELIRVCHFLHRRFDIDWDQTQTAGLMLIDADWDY